MRVRETILLGVPGLCQFWELTCFWPCKSVKSKASLRIKQKISFTTIADYRLYSSIFLCLLLFDRTKSMLTCFHVHMPPTPTALPSLGTENKECGLVGSGWLDGVQRKRRHRHHLRGGQGGVPLCSWASTVWQKGVHCNVWSNINRKKTILQIYRL